MLRYTRYSWVCAVWTLVVCGIAQSTLINVDNVVRSYDGAAVTSTSTKRYVESIWERENGLGALPTAESTSSNGGGHARARGLRASADVNEVSNSEVELIFATGTSAYHSVSFGILWIPSYARCTASVDFVGSFKPSDVFGSDRVAFLSERQSTGSDNTGTLTISSGTTELFSSPLAALPQELFHVTAPPGATVTIHVNLSSNSYASSRKWLDSDSDADSQDFRLRVMPMLVRTIIVDPNGDIAAASALANPGDTVQIAAGTYLLASHISIKDGVTYKGAGPGLTIIDGNNVTRAFVAWGDRGATNGQVDANNVGIRNATGPKNWVLEGMTIQNCVADTKDRQDILSSARDLLTNYKAVPYTLATAQTENGSLVDNPGWFDILSGGADDNLTDVELAAYLAANPVGSAGHLVVNDNQDGDGGAIILNSGAAGAIRNCEFLNNHTPIPGAGDDGGAIKMGGLSTLTIEDCLFDGNYACSPTSVAESDATGDADGDGGHIRVEGGSASAITPGTTLIANRCIFLNGNAEDDGGAIHTGAVGTIVRLDACRFEGNTAWDNGSVMSIGTEGSGELTVTNCVFANNITKATNGPDRMCEVRRNSKFVNCTFVGNNQNDEDLIYNNADVADTNADGVDDELADTTQVINCVFVNNIVGNGDDIMGSRDAAFTVAATNCLFFGNKLQNGNAADNTQRTELEKGSVNADALLDANYVPGAGSLAIDAGVDPATLGVALTTDYSGNARPQGAGYDIGAYEFVVAPPAN